LSLFHFIEGKLDKIYDKFVIVSLDFFSFRVICGEKDLSFLSNNVGQKVKIYISESIDKEEIKIFGFLDENKRDLFEDLKRIKGVGEKIALRIVDYFSPEEFKEILESEDINALLKVPGVGKKVAQKIFLEKNGLLPKEKKEEGTIRKALYNLGYSKEEVDEVMKEIRKEFKDFENVEEIIKFALQRLSKEL
jgi:Holliday junction DNA helicase RuvA